MELLEIVKIGEYVIAVAILILLLPLPTAFSSLGLFLVGLGNGPLYPNFSYLTPSNFGEENAEAVMGTEQVFAYIGATGVPAVFGIIAQVFGLWLFPIFLLVFFIPLAIGTMNIIRLKSDKK